MLAQANPLIRHTSVGDYMQLAGEKPTCESERLRWYAVYTRSRHEKRVQQQFEGESIECFLPLHEAVHRWKNGRALVSLPLFPSYLFVRIVGDDRMRVLRKHGVVDLVGTHGRPTPIPDPEIDTLRFCFMQRARMEPHSYLTVGERVRVWNGPFAEMEGILLRKKGTCRLVLSINLIARSVAVEIDSSDVVPVVSPITSSC